MSGAWPTQLSWTCACCRHPLLYPGLTLTHVQEDLPSQQVQQLLNQVLQRDLQPLLQQPQQQQLGDAGHQFVMSRTLMLGAQLQESATAQQRQHLLQAAAAAGEDLSLLLVLLAACACMLSSRRRQV